MASKLHILVAGRSKPAIERLAALLGQQGRFRFDTRHISNGHADPLWGLDYTPDLVVLLLSGQGHEDLVALGEEQSALRPPMIVIAEQGDAQSMRFAMQAGARDFMHGTVSQDDLVASIERVSSQVAKSQPIRTGRLTAIVNAKGGSGATFIASNVAHIQAAVSQRSTALVSLDMQFNSLAHYFDMKLRHGLLQVLESANDLDAVALDAYMTPHESGVRILGALPARHFEHHSEKPAQLGTLLRKMQAHYDDVVVDMPRRVDGYTAPVLEQATLVVLVVQQTLSHLQDATRMLQILRDFDVDESNVLVVLNRFEKSSAVGVAEIKKALQGVEVVTVPSHFKLVAESINLGVPMYKHAKGSPVTKALMALETRLGGSAAKGNRGLLSRTFGLMKKESSWPQA
jgi:pilus assembly protein CpaE